MGNRIWVEHSEALNKTWFLHSFLCRTSVKKVKKKKNQAWKNQVTQSHAVIFTIYSITEGNRWSLPTESFMSLQKSCSTLTLFLFCFVLFYIALFSCFIALKATLLLNTCLASGCHCSYLLVLLYRYIHSRKAVFFLAHIITVFFYCPLSFCHLIISIWIADVSLSFKSQSDDIQLVHSHEMIEIWVNTRWVISFINFGWDIYVLMGLSEALFRLYHFLVLQQSKKSKMSFKSVSIIWKGYLW